PVADRGPDRRPIVWAWISGAVAGLSGLAIAELVSWILTPLGDPITAVSQFVVGLLPSGLINFGKETLGFADKPVLLTIVTLVAVGIAGLSGRLEYARRGIGAIGTIVLALICLVAVGSQQDAGVTAFLPVIIGSAIAYPILRMLIGRLRLWAETAAD